VACATVDLVTAAILLAWAFAFVLVVAAAVVHLRQGREACEAERDRLLEERRAFQQFVRQVESLETADAAGTRVPAGATASLSHPQDGGTLDDVVRAYRETVMSVDHYETDYGEPLRQNMAAELGADVTTAVLDGQGLHPQLKMAVMSKSTEAYEQRTNVLDDIDDEVSEIARASEEIESVETTLERLDRHSLLNKSFKELRSDYDALCALDGDCTDLIDDRQETVATREPSPNPDEGHDFHSYLYDPLDVSYPVLSAALSTLSTVRSARRRVLDSLTRRV
jgi:prefoldin subunit 5